MKIGMSIKIGMKIIKMLVNINEKKEENEHDDLLLFKVKD